MIKRIIAVSAIQVLFFAKLIAQQATTDSIKFDYTDPKEYEIADITVKGVEFIDNKLLVQLGGLTVGQKITLPGDEITKVVKKLWDHGLFSEVSINVAKIDSNKVYLEYQMKERRRLQRIEITGIRKGQIDDVKELIKLKPGMQLTDNILSNSAMLIKKHFSEKGFLNTEVTMVQKDDTASNRVALTIIINKNGRVRIKDIVFIGNNSFKDGKLRHKMKKTKRVNLNFFKPSKLVAKEYKEDKEKLIEFYNEQGYRNARLVSDSIVKVSQKRVKIYITVDEGRKFYLGNIAWVGNTKYPTEVLNKVLNIKKGDIYNQPLLEKRLTTDEDAVNSLYLDNGYLFFSITPVETKIYGDTIDLEMRMTEGPQATINNIIISGNTKTNEHVIRRELYTRPGELFSKSDLIRSVRELANLGHFDAEKIEPVPIPNPSDGTVDIQYKLVEKANDQLEISGGWGMGMFIGTVGIRFTNFSARNMFDLKSWRPVPSGDGQTLSLRVQSNGGYYRAYNMSFMDPWFGGKKPNSFSFSLSRSVLDYSKNTYYSSYYGTTPDSAKMAMNGVSVGFGKRLKWPDDFFSIYTELSFNNYVLKYFPNFIFSDGRSNNINLKISLSRNSVDRLIYPRSGSNYSLTLQITPPYSLFRSTKYKDDADHYFWVEYHKWSFKAQNYISIVGDLVLYTGAQFGYLGKFTDRYGYSPFESFDLGGSGMAMSYDYTGREIVALRGYEDLSVTPQIKSVSGSIVKAGNVYDKMTLEIRYPFSLNPSATFYGLVFAEGGNAWSDIKLFSPFNMKRSFGVGVRAFLPMFGMLGVDWGYGLDDIKNAYNQNKSGVNGSQWHFTFGQQF
jgi:outer membrane protein insertion porin family